MTITETKIRGLEVRIDEHKIKILDSFQIKDRKKMKMILENALDKDSEFKTERTIKSLIKEWVSHNRLYKIHFFRKINKDCVLSKKITIIGRIIYSILGI